MATEPTKTVTASTMTSRRKRRWGDAVTTEENDNNNASATLTATDGDNNNKNATAVVNAVENVNVAVDGNRSGNGNALPPPTSTTTHPPPLVAITAATAGTSSDAMARAAALQASIRERLAALKARTAHPTSTATVGAVGASMTLTTPIVATTTTLTNDDDNDASQQHKHKKAKIFELDMSSTASTRLLERRQRREERLRSASGSTVAEKHRVENDSNRNQPKEKSNPYLAHIVTTSSDLNDGGKKKKKKDALNMHKAMQEEELQLLDTRLSAPQKSRPKSRPIHFVEPGTYIALGEKKRFIASKAEESGYISGRKVGNVVKSVGMGGGGGETNAIEAESIEENTAGSGSYYGSSEAGGKSIIEQRLPPRHDAPEIELEEFTAKKRILTSVSDVNVEQNEDAILNAVQDAVSSMPYAVEWWDAELLPSKLRKELAEEEGKAIASRTRKQQPLGSKSATTSIAATNAPVVDAMVEDDKATCSDRNQPSAAVAQFHSQNERQKELIAKCYKMASISHSKTHSLIQHPVPILTPAQLAAKEALKNKPPTLHLTKAEQKRHRKLRRAERLREQQDLQAAGLIPPPEPRLTLSNYMKVLGDQAVIDPSKMEAVVMNQIQGRKLKHDQMNAERKLTKEQKAAKHAKKLQEDTSRSVHVALFYVKDMSHPYHRTKVDLNAQQNGITGGVLECSNATSTNGNYASSSMALVIAEGGEKALKRYVRLMTVRMRWKGEDFYEQDDDDGDDDDDHDHEDLMVGDNDNDGDGMVEGGEGDTTKKKKERKKFNPNNECELIWSGMAVKRAFNTFMFQSAESTIVARKILEAKGVAHYWDLALGHVDGKKD